MDKAQIMQMRAARRSIAKPTCGKLLWNNAIWKSVCGLPHAASYAEFQEQVGMRGILCQFDCLYSVGVHNTSLHTKFTRKLLQHASNCQWLLFNNLQCKMMTSL
jgi:hypothetical protein